MLALLGSGGSEVVFSATNPYAGLTARNAFGIQPPAPPSQPEIPQAPPPPPPNVFLTGVSQSGGRKKAYFSINRPGGKQPDYETLSEGEEIEDLKVVEIQAKEGKVRTIIGGKEITLSFAENGIKTAGTPGAPGVPGKPGVPGQPAVPSPVPGQPTPITAAPASSGGPVLIGRGGINRSTDAGANNPAPVSFPVNNGGGGFISGGVINNQNTDLLTRTTPATPINATPVVAPVPAGGGDREPLPLPPIPTRFNP